MKTIRFASACLFIGLVLGSPFAAFTGTFILVWRFANG